MHPQNAMNNAGSQGGSTALKITAPTKVPGPRLYLHPTVRNAGLRHRTGIKERQRIVKFPMLRPRLSSARDSEQSVEDLPANRFYGCLPSRNPTRVDVHEIVPATGQIRTRRNF